MESLTLPSFSKVFAIDYYKINDGLWRAKNRVEDPIYNVLLTLDLSVPDFIIRDASVRMLNYPRRECEKAAAKIKELIGADVRGQYRDILRREYLGPQGCDTIFNLVNTAGRTFVIAYAEREKGLSGLTEAEFFDLVGGVRCVVGLGKDHIPEPFSSKDCVPALTEPEHTQGSTTPDDWDGNDPVFGRRLTVDYFEPSDDIWRVRAQINDFQHNIVLTLDVSTDDLVVRDANITFLRQPFGECDLVIPRMKKIVGSCLSTDFRQRAARDFVGMEGCGNVFSALNTIHHGFLQFYLWRRTVLGKISPQQESLCKEGLKQDCIACGL